MAASLLTPFAPWQLLQVVALRQKLASCNGPSDGRCRLPRDRGASSAAVLARQSDSAADRAPEIEGTGLRRRQQDKANEDRNDEQGDRGADPDGELRVRRSLSAVACQWTCTR